MTTTIRPLGDRVLLRRIDAETQTASGLVIPDGAQEKPLEAIVEAVGGDVDDVKPGDRVLFGKYAGTEVDDGALLMVRVEDVLGVVDDV